MLKKKIYEHSDFTSNNPDFFNKFNNHTFLFS